MRMRPLDRTGIAFELLEPRAHLAVIAWDGGPTGNGTDWHTPANWAGDVLPGPQDDVVVDVATSPTISLNNTIGASIRSLLLRETLVIVNGTLAIAEAANVVGGTVRLQGGSVQGGQWDVTQGAFLGTSPSTAGSSNRLIGVALTGNLTVQTSSAIRIVNGLELTGTLSIASNGRLLVEGTQALTTTGAAIVTGTGSAASLQFAGSAAQLSISAGVTIRNLGLQVFSGSGHAIFNHGRLLAESGQLSVTGLQVTNLGSLEAVAGGSLTVYSTSSLLGAAGSLVVSGTSSSLSLWGNFTLDQELVIPSGTSAQLGGAWANTATVRMFGGTLQIYGEHTIATLGAIVRDQAFPGVVRFGGTLDLEGDTLELNQTRGSWVFNGGTVSGGLAGGEIVALPGYQVSFSSATLRNLTVTGSVLVGGNAVLTGGNIFNGTVQLETATGLIVSDGFELNGTFTYTGTLSLRFDGTQAITTTSGGTLNVGASGTFQNFNVQGTGARLTIGAGVTLRTSGYSRIQSSAGSGQSLIVEGGLVAEGSGAQLQLGLPVVEVPGSIRAIAGSWIQMSSGALQGAIGELVLSGASHLKLLGSYSFASDLSLVAGSSLELFGTWANQGSITVAGGTLLLGGSFTLQSLGSVVRTSPGSGAVHIVGILDLAGETLSLNAATGSWLVGATGYGGATITGGTQGGTIEMTAGSFLTVTAGTLSLDNIALNGSLSVQTSLYITNGLRLNGGVQIAAGGGVTFYGDQSIITTGAGAITLGNGFVLSGPVGSTPTLTIGANVVVGGSGQVRGSGTVINNGVLGSSGTLEVLDLTVVNNGTIRAVLGGRTKFTTGRIVGPVGSLVVQGEIELNGTYQVSNNVIVAATYVLTLRGTWSNQATITLSGGRVVLAGSYTPASIGQIVRTTSNPGVLALAGTLNLEGTVFAVGPATGSIELGAFGQNGVFLNGGIAGGEFQVLPGYTVTNPSFACMVSNITLSGTMSLRPLTVSGGLRVNGTITVEGLTFIGDQAVTTNTAGSLLFNIGGGTMSVGYQGASATVTLGPGIILRGANTTPGIAIVGAGPSSMLVNHGQIVTGAGTWNVSALRFSNYGTVEAAGASLQFGANVVHADYEGASATLLRGTWISRGGGIGMAIPIRSIGPSATIVLDGTASSFPSLSGLELVQGELRLSGGRNLTVTPASGTLQNDGSLDIGAGSMLTVSGNFTQGTGGDLRLHIGTLVAIGRLSAVGAVSLAGHLSLLVSQGFTPGTSANLSLITGSSITGAFDEIAMTPGAAGMFWRLRMSGGTLSLYAASPTWQVAGARL